MDILNIKNYLEGSKEEIEAVEAHRKASPYKISYEPKYDQKIQRLPRKKKKQLKSWYKKNQIRFFLPLMPHHISQRFKEKKKFVKAVYLDMFKIMNSMKHNK